ncbi:helix-turn-helix domain-containing protein [Nocardia pseudovaccinii]|uniref:helix-turn-helix domain-containing protein n=1 Tax=Nocardia pseudovaccinii TaxID=189540 RepID=UPI0007A4D560|nr:helix-turn-helix domain-containing protein [Nocardia pseudovaccinii]
MANEQLTEARLALGWTQAELAAAVAEHILASTGKTTGIDADYVSRLERGLISWPTRATRCALEVLLGRTAWELGLVNRRLGGPRRRRIPGAGGRGETAPRPSARPLCLVIGSMCSVDMKCLGTVPYPGMAGELEPGRAQGFDDLLP